MNGIISSRKNVENRITEEIADDCYKKAIRYASDETGLPRSAFPKERPVDWTVSNVKDKKYISEFMKNLAHTDVVIDYLNRKE